MSKLGRLSFLTLLGHADYRRPLRLPAPCGVIGPDWGGINWAPRLRVDVPGSRVCRQPSVGDDAFASVGLGNLVFFLTTWVYARSWLCIFM